MTGCLEICLSADDEGRLARNASLVHQAGAKRVELCAAMGAGGLTPTVQAVQIARQHLPGPCELLVMLRPHARSFCYNQLQLDNMCRDMQTFARAGADGVVMGPLTEEGNIDQLALSVLLEKASSLDLKTTFHRAFDSLTDWQSALPLLVASGVNRLLSSGTPWGSDKGALDGLDKLEKIAGRLGPNMELVIGGGVNPNNAAQLWAFARKLPCETSLHAYSGALAGDDVMPALVQPMLAPSAKS